MDCNEVRPLIDAYVDNELAASEARRVHAHLARCGECRQASAAVLALSHAVRTAEYHRAPEGLRARIALRLPETAVADEPLPPRRRLTFASWINAWRLPMNVPGTRAAGAFAARFGTTAALTLAFCAAAAIAVAIVAGRPPAASQAFVDELVASHVRAQLSGRDIDVVSSDQHTVKPWFNGRLDYAPPVVDLASSGFALVGGRLDYVGHRRVAVLVYRYRKHVVDAYVLPDTDAGGGIGAKAPEPADAAAPRVHEGYALASWRERGMRWWAVTDASPDVLAQFEATLRATLRAPS
jgi:anti-sigma factor (TIGR02949 family)